MTPNRTEKLQNEHRTIFVLSVCRLLHACEMFTSGLQWGVTDIHGGNGQRREPRQQCQRSEKGRSRGMLWIIRMLGWHFTPAEVGDK
jgi:hypothetical protein